MSQRVNTYLRNCLRRFGARCDSVVCQGRFSLPQRCPRQRNRRASYIASLLLITFVTHPILTQEKSPDKSPEALQGA